MYIVKKHFNEDLYYPIVALCWELSGYCPIPVLGGVTIETVVDLILIVIAVLSLVVAAENRYGRKTQACRLDFGLPGAGGFQRLCHFAAGGNPNRQLEHRGRCCGLGVGRDFLGSDHCVPAAKEVQSKKIREEGLMNNWKSYCTCTDLDCPLPSLPARSGLYPLRAEKTSVRGRSRPAFSSWWRIVKSRTPTFLKTLPTG